MSTTFVKFPDCDLNEREIEFVKNYCANMLATDAIEAYVDIGKRCVCFKKDKDHIAIHAMQDSLVRNEIACTRFNKRK